MFGEVIIPTIIMSAIYWCINNKVGMYILWNSAFAFLSNIILKITTCIYRPWMIDLRIHPVETALKSADGYSFPSGHTAGATAVWGGTAVGFWKNKAIRYSMIALMFFVAFSRNYLGVHTPQDVTVSIIVGIFFLWFSKKIFIWTQKEKNRDIILVVSINIICLLTIVYSMIKGYPTKSNSGHILIDPEEIKLNVISRMGYVTGIFNGWLIDRRFIQFDATIGTIKGKIIRFFIGGGLLYTIITSSKIMFLKLMGVKLGYFSQAFTLTIFITAIYPYLVSTYQKATTAEE